MARNVITKTVVYRKFNKCNGSWSSASLEKILLDICKTTLPDGKQVKDDWAARRFPISNSDSHYYFAHALEYKDKALFGMLCVYSPDEFQAIIKEENIGNDDLDTFLRKIEIAEKEPPKGENYLKGHAYFLIVKNHVFMIQHLSVRTNTLESYLHDLMRKYDYLPEDGTFELQSKLNLTDVTGGIGDYKAVEIGGVTAYDETISSSPMEPTVTDVTTSHDLAHGRTKGGMGLDILRKIFGNMEADKIMQAVPDEAELEVDVKFGFKSKSRKLNRAVLSQIASAARDLPEGQVRAIGKDGKVTGNDLRLQSSMPFDRLRPNGTLLDLENTRSQLLKVYHRFVDDGKIPQ